MNSEKANENTSPSIVNYPSLIGSTIEGYKILAEIGRGGMGMVYKAFDVNLEKEVAIKIMSQSTRMDEKFIKHFRDEAKALAKLENQHIVRAYALLNTEAGLFIVMEYVAGKNMEILIQEKGPIPFEEAKHYCRQLLRALRYAHNAGVIHRDIKPSNVILSNDNIVKLTDFGLAKIKAHADAQTTTGFTAGTLGYMSPERLLNPAIADTRCDIYSLGMTFYEMVVGTTPLKNIGDSDLIQKAILKGDFPTPSEVNPEVPEKFSRIIDKCIEKNPQKRYQNVLQILEDMDRLDQKVQKKKKSFLKYIISGLAAVIIIVILVFLPFTNKNVKNVNSPEGNRIIEKPSPTNADYGSITIKTTPTDAEIIIDEQLKGKGKFHRDSIASRYHKIRVHKDGYMDWKDSLYVISSLQNPTLEVRLDPVPAYNPVPVYDAYLQLDSDLQCEIYIDNNNQKVAENTKIPVKAGSHDILFKHAKFGSKNFPIFLKPNENRKITCYFEQLVSIQAEPDTVWGMVLINDESTEYYSRQQFPLPPGKYSISVKKNKYQTDEPYINLTIEPDTVKRDHPLIFHFRPVN